jgi:DNA polymerase III delta subunit
MSWSKIWLAEGCPYYIDWFIEDLVDDLGNPSILKFDSNSSTGEITSALTAFPFFDVPDLVVIKNPNTEILNACLNSIDSLRCSGLVLTCEYNTFDGRQSFVSKASKNKKLKTFEFTEQGDDLSSFFKVWKNRINFSADCLPWLNKNAPTRLAKAKVNGQKKDITIIDLIKIDQELNKIYSIYLADKKQITVEDLKQYCNFSKESEIWALFDAVINGDLAYIVNYFNKYKLTTNNEGPLWVIASQLELYLQIKSNTNSSIADALTLSKKINYYLNDNFETIGTVSPKAQINPYRLKMASDSCAKVSIDSLIDKYLATISSIRDLRSGLAPELISGLLCLAYSGKNKYLQPFYDV